MKKPVLLRFERVSASTPSSDEDEASQLFGVPRSSSTNAVNSASHYARQSSANADEGDPAGKLSRANSVPQKDQKPPKAMRGAFWRATSAKDSAVGPANPLAQSVGPNGVSGGGTDRLGASQVQRRQPSNRDQVSPRDAAAANGSGGHSSHSPLGPNEYQVYWETGSLGLFFGEDRSTNLPVVTRSTPSANPVVRRAVAINDTLVSANGIKSADYTFEAFFGRLQQMNKPVRSDIHLETVAMAEDAELVEDAEVIEEAGLAEEAELIEDVELAEEVDLALEAEVAEEAELAEEAGLSCHVEMGVAVDDSEAEIEDNSASETDNDASPWDLEPEPERKKAGAAVPRDEATSSSGGSSSIDSAVAASNFADASDSSDEFANDPDISSDIDIVDGDIMMQEAPKDKVDSANAPKPSKASLHANLAKYKKKGKTARGITKLPALTEEEALTVPLVAPNAVNTTVQWKENRSIGLQLKEVRFAKGTYPLVTDVCQEPCCELLRHICVGDVIIEINGRNTSTMG
ncbi:isoform h [Phytophthora cinnamomi]|uniref:isoform h n=1 Tax=Phytophthora cinnamomi TaxID=4785 RepID=UPI003559E37E|nr:isoform h [Phytophthora cinnamomi]